MKFDLCVLGLGYIGLPTAALAAKAGMNVLGVDIIEHVVERVNNGEVHLEEPGLPEVVAEVVKAGRLQAALSPTEAEIYMIAVPTPVDHKTHKPDMSLVRKAAESIAKVAAPGALVILQSTSPVGATEQHVKAVIESVKPPLKGKLEYVYCPERAIPGKTMQEMVQNDRAVGGMSEAATERALAFYKKFVTGALLPTDAATAEMVKLVENASRDVQIAFANELSLACGHMGLDVWKVIELANHHPRVNILKPGPGVGGHCIAVDPWFIIDAAPAQTPLMQTARKVNDGKPDWVVEKVKEACAGLQNPTVCLLGLAYKENVDDFRESPSVVVAEKIKAIGGAEVLVVEPYMDISEDYKLVNLEEGLVRSDVIVMLTPHREFEAIKPEDLQNKAVIDTRGVLPVV